MAYTITAQDRLNQAEDALHQKLMDGSARVFVDQNGERVEYSVPSIPRLKGYILQLQIELGQTCLPTPLSPRIL
jgi:hypothetical protein